MHLNASFFNAGLIGITPSEREALFVQFKPELIDVKGYFKE